MASKKAFTLAEVLFALTVVGIVAALTIPALLQDIGHADAVSRLLKSYSTIYAAQNMLKAEGNDMVTVFAGDSQHANVANAFATKLNVIKNCGTGTGCFSSSNYLSTNGQPAVVYNINSDTNYAKLTTSDGMSLAFLDYLGSCTPDCGIVLVDLNGPKSPNIIARDLFKFYVFKDTVMPQGYNSDPNTCTTVDYGFDCTARVIKERAMSY